MRSKLSVIAIVAVLLSCSFAWAESNALEPADRRMRFDPQAVAGETEADIQYGSSDSAIRSRLEQALRDAQLTGVRDLSVEVRNGTAYLSGSATKHEAIDEALSTALMVSGVEEIKNQIVLVNPPPIYSSGKWAGAYSTAGAG